MAKILVVDDESRIRDIITQYLKFDGFTYGEALNGEQAVEKFFKNGKDEYQLIVMDIMMPFMDGITALRLIREKSDVPVILLTAKGEEYDKVFGLDLGADDYIVKPFSPKELLARIRAILKRVDNKIQKDALYNYKNLCVNFTSYDVKIGEEKVSLTPKEFEILKFFISKKGIVVTRETLLGAIWGYDFYGDSRTVDSHIKMLRNSLGQYRDLIKTVWGVGYRYDEF